MRKTSGVTSEDSSQVGRRADPPRRIRADAPAKINLTLEILGRREDGFHELRSLVVGVGLYDTVSCTLAPEGSFTIQCSDKSLSTPDNLAVRAAKALAATLPDHPDHPDYTGLAIELTKRIPVGGGLGGGSSDAATVLSVFNELLGGHLSPQALAKLGSEIGSDVALFFGLPCAVMTGRGEIVEPVELEWRGSALLICPKIHIATRDVYAAHRSSDRKRSARGAEETILGASSADEITEALTNQLEPAVFRVSPALEGLVEDLSNVGYGDIRVSGSGSTVFGLFDDPQEASHAAKTIAQRFPNVKTSVVATPVGMNPFFVSEDN